METNKIVIASVIGLVVTFLLGFLSYGLLLSSFFESNTGSATGLMKPDEEMSMIPMVLGHWALGALLAIILGRWANISTFSSGAMAGAVIGFLMSAGYGLINFGSMNMFTLTGHIADIVVATIVMAITGGAIGYYYGMQKK